MVPILATVGIYWHESREVEATRSSSQSRQSVRLVKDKEIIVASFCTKCGATVVPDTQFCTVCGAPVEAGSVSPVVPPAAAYPPASGVAYPPPPATYAQQPPPFQPAAPYQPAPPPSSGNSAVKIILIIVGVFVGLGILGACIFAFTVWRVAHAIHVDNSNGQGSLNTPGGKIPANQMQSFTSSELGTDIYPGAQGGKGGMKMDLPTGSMVTGVFVTSDSKDQVVAYYRNKFGSGASVYDTANGALLTLNKGQQEVVTVTVSSNSSQDDGKTRIAIMHTKSNKAS
jgi:hypothetical protein